MVVAQAPFFNSLFLTLLYALEAAEQEGVGRPCTATVYGRLSGSLPGVMRMNYVVWVPAQ